MHDAEVVGDDDRGLKEDHRQRQPLSHGAAREQEADLRIRLAEQLAEAAGDAVAEEEEAGQQARPPLRPQPQRQQQQLSELDAPGVLAFGSSGVGSAPVMSM